MQELTFTYTEELLYRDADVDYEGAAHPLHSSDSEIE